MNDSIKEGLEGLSKMDGVSNFLYALMYWVGVIFVLLFVTYIFVSIYAVSYTHLTLPTILRV